MRKRCIHLLIHTLNNIPKHKEHMRFNCYYILTQAIQVEVLREGNLLLLFYLTSL